jgi:hypothetical protein
MCVRRAAPSSARSGSATLPQGVHARTPGLRFTLSLEVSLLQPTGETRVPRAWHTPARRLLLPARPLLGATCGDAAAARRRATAPGARF